MAVMVDEGVLLEGSVGVDFGSTWLFGVEVVREDCRAGVVL